MHSCLEGSVFVRIQSLHSLCCRSHLSTTASIKVSNIRNCTHWCRRTAVGRLSRSIVLGDVLSFRSSARVYRRLPSGSAFDNGAFKGVCAAVLPEMGLVDTGCCGCWFCSDCGSGGCDLMAAGIVEASKLVVAAAERFRKARSSSRVYCTIGPCE